MLRAVLDSFLRAVIRFWDNRFIRPDNPLELYRMELAELRSKNRELTNYILDTLNPTTAKEDEPEVDEEFQQLGRPIETTLAKRKRLEQESFAEWNRLVQEATSKVTKTTDELEKDLLKGIN